MAIHKVKGGETLRIDRQYTAEQKIVSLFHFSLEKKLKNLSVIPHITHFVPLLISKHTFLVNNLLGQKSMCFKQEYCRTLILAKPAPQNKEDILINVKTNAANYSLNITLLKHRLPCIAL